MNAKHNLTHQNTSLFDTAGPRKVKRVSDVNAMGYTYNYNQAQPPNPYGSGPEVLNVPLNNYAPSNGKFLL